MCSLLNHHIEHNSRLHLMSSWPPTEDKMSLTLKSKVHKKQSVLNIAFGVDHAYSVRVDPNVDYGFIVALVAILNEINEEKCDDDVKKFGGWLGKNSTMGKNYRLIEDEHAHLLLSLPFNLG
ncbi:replication factor C subunit 1, partial [Tanacetum coccineum]